MAPENMMNQLEQHFNVLFL